MRLTIPFEDCVRLEQKLGSAIPPPSASAFTRFMADLKTTNPELAAEIEATLKPVGIPDAVKVQANKARENAKFAGILQRLFMKETVDGFVVHKRKVNAWAVAGVGALVLVGTLAVVVKPAPKSSLALSGVLGSSDATLEPANDPSGAKPRSTPSLNTGQAPASSATTPPAASSNANPASSSQDRVPGPQQIPQGAGPGVAPASRSASSRAAGGGPSRTTAPSRSVRPAVNLATTSYVVPTNDSSYPAPSGSSAQSGASGGVDELDAPASSGSSRASLTSRTPSGPAIPGRTSGLAFGGDTVRPGVTLRAPLPRLTARPIAVQGTSRPLVPKAAFSIQSVTSPPAPSAPRTPSVAASSVTTATASGLAISARELPGAAPASPSTPGLGLATSEAPPSRSAPGLSLAAASREPPGPPAASGGISISSLEARAATPSSAPQATGGIGLGATTPAVRAQDGFPGATPAQGQAQGTPPSGLPSASVQGLEAVLPKLYTGIKLEASLTVALVAVEQNVAPFVAVTRNPPCPKPECPPITWIGQALLGPDRRVWVSIDQASYGGQTYAVKGQALGIEDLRPGLAAEVSEEAPTLVSDLLRGSIGAFSDYLSAQLGAKTTTLIPGGGAVSSGSLPDLVNFFGARAAGLFSLPSDAKALIRVARVVPDARLLVLYGVPPALGGGSK